MYKFYQYNDNQCRIVITNSSSIFHKNKEDDKHYLSGNTESDICSLSRAKRMIREYSLCNDFKYFFTSTVNSEMADRYSLSECQKNIRKIMKSIKRKNKDFIYLFITEKHKDGAFHFHGLCSDLELYINNFGYYSSKDFDKLGFNSFSKIRSKEKVSNYITKYITKACVKNESGSIYFCSRGLKRAITYELIDFDIYKSGLKLWKNDFVIACDFNISDLSKEQILYLLNNLQEKNNFFDRFLNKSDNDF